MPMGSPRSTDPGLNANGTVAATIGIANGTSSAQRSQYNQQQQAQGSGGMVGYTVIGIVILYALWALLIQHERVKETLQPANVAANLHNFIVVGVQALIFIVVGKVALTKLTALGIPGAAQVAQVFQAG